MLFKGIKEIPAFIHNQEKKISQQIHTSDRDNTQEDRNVKRAITNMLKELKKNEHKEQRNRQQKKQPNTTSRDQKYEI